MTVHDNELVMASWWRLANAPHASLCVSSSFCLWPILGAPHGYLVAGPLFPHADELSDKVPSLGVVKGPKLMAYRSFGGGDKRPSCGTSVPKMRAAINGKLGGALNKPANATVALAIRGAPAPPLVGGWPAARRRGRRP